jgi:tRNA (uracil-5-)-methyltransferase
VKYTRRLDTKQTSNNQDYNFHEVLDNFVYDSHPNTYLTRIIISLKAQAPIMSIKELMSILSEDVVDEAHYQGQLSNKVGAFKVLLDQSISYNKNISLDIFESPRKHYRLRAEFKVWHDGEQTHFAMTEKATKELVYLQQFPVAIKPINQLMPKLLSAICQHEITRKKCFQVEFLSTLTGDTLVSLIYHKRLDDEWIEAMTPIKEQLGINIVGRSRKQKIVLDRDYVNESLNVNNQMFHYKQIEGGFSQPNGKICEQMLAWAVDNSREFSGDLLELYCGNGNFTLPLSQNFNRVIATEISKTSVNAALANLEKNDINNVAIVRMSSEEFVEAMDKKREFRRLKNIDLDTYAFSSVFVDPPRAGLDAATVSMVQRFDNIIYISCNPETLINNLQILTQTHTIKSLAAFDQFPYSDHLETGVILSKKP